MRTRLLALGLAGSLAVLAGVALWRPWAGGPPLAGEMAAFALAEPAAAPEISFFDAAGNSLDLGDFRGRVVLLNLWATWCAPCVEEMPALDRLQQALGGDRFQVVAVSLDREGLADVGPFFDAHDIDALEPYIDRDGTALRALRTPALPTTALIDAAGRLVGTYTGAAAWDGPDAQALIRHYLDAAPGG